MNYFHQFNYIALKIKTFVLEKLLFEFLFAVNVV